MITLESIMPYQSFPWQQGDSQSLKKLVSLFLPDLSGKKVLDAGCNTGFFCGWAKFSQAGHVLGVDINPAFIEEARKLFPDCHFQCGSWDTFDETGFDLVLFLSALHYAADQQQAIDSLMKCLSPDGVMVLELGIAPGTEDAFVSVKRQNDVRQFPTWAKLHSMLGGYTYKSIGPGTPQAGDPIPRYVVHISHKKPVAILLLGPSYSGKSFLAKTVFRNDLPIISGDVCLHELASGARRCSDKLAGFLLGKNVANCALVMQELCTAGLVGQYADTVLQMSSGRDFVYDGFIPEAFHLEFMEHLHKNGIYVLDMAVYSARRSPRSLPAPSEETLLRFVEYLKGRFGFDEEAYLAANPDVAKAVATKAMHSGFNHYVFFGRRENRPLR